MYSQELAAVTTFSMGDVLWQRVLTNYALVCENVDVMDILPHLPVAGANEAGCLTKGTKVGFST